MDCCGEYRARGPYAGGGGGGGAGAGAAWDAPAPATYAPAPLPYATAAYAHYYPPLPHDPYRYYRYDYPHHTHHNDHVMSMDYGAYASKEARVRRALARRDARALPPAHHLPLPPTPPLECGMNGRGPPYCEPQMWSPYQMGFGGWNGANASGAWMSRGSCAREHMRYPQDCRPLKGPHLHAQNQVCPPEGRSTSFPMYEESLYGADSVRRNNTPEYGAGGSTPRPAEARVEVRAEMRPEARAEGRAEVRAEVRVEPRRAPPEEQRPPVVPLPAFQQAFGSTEIGKFAEAFSREVAPDEPPADYGFDSFPEWDQEPQWQPPPAAREIKCEDNY